MTRARDLSNDEANGGGATPPYVAGKNAIINGGFDIWQRGTSFTSNSYTADRWYSAIATSVTTISRQSPGSTLPQFQYGLRTQRNSGSTDTTSQQLGYTLETADSLRFAGQTIVVSFYVRAGANYSAASSVLYFLLNYGTGTNERLLAAGFTGNTNLIFTGPVISTSWQRISYSVAIPITATEIGFYWQANVAGTAGAADYFDITGVQLEIGSVATPFSRAGGTIQGELAACQRYYYRLTSTDDVFSRFAFGSATASTNGQFLFTFPVQMRVKPSALDTSAASTLSLWDGATDSFVTAISGMTRQSVNNASVDFTTAATMTQYRPYWAISRNTTSAYVGFSAEL
jgi:hypothetical protein